MVRLDGARFSRRRNGEMAIIRGMVYAKMFYWGWCCFSGGWHLPAPSST